MASLELVSEVRADLIDTLRDELADYYQQMRNLGGLPADEVMRLLSAWVARAGEMRMALIWNEGRREMAFRTKILDPFISHCELQFKFHSRIVAIAEMELSMERS